MGIRTRTASRPEFSPSVPRGIAAPPTEPREQTPHENTISVAADAVPASRPVAKAAARANDVLNVIWRAAPITGCCQRFSCRPQPTIPKSDRLLEQMNAIANRLTSDLAQPPGREPLQRRLGLRG